MAAGMREEDERRAAHVRAYELVQMIQGDVPGAAEELVAITEMAEARGWAEVRRAGVFGRAVISWIRRDPALNVAIAALADLSGTEGDDAMLALALALRSDVAFTDLPGRGESGAMGSEADLAKAMVLLEQVEGGSPLERVSAHTACGIALGNRLLFELGDEQYGQAVAVAEGQPAGTMDFIIAPVMFNRAEVQVQWASMLRLLGDREGVALRRQAWQTVKRAASAFEIPQTWRTELDALGLLLGAIAGEDTSAEARNLLATVNADQDPLPRSLGLLQLAVALSDHGQRRPTALAGAAQAVQWVNASLHPQVYDLALGLLAELEATEGRDAGLRLARRQLAEHWASRVSSLGSMRSRIQSERMAVEREMLGRHSRLDDLTGLSNRRALQQYLETIQRQGVQTVALMMLDCDVFKSVNDRYGHLAGDAVLIRIAATLQSGIRPSDLAVRLGGDEFAVILAGADLDIAYGRAVDILTQLGRASFDDIGAGLAVAVSAGVAAGAPGDILGLRADADAALYDAKAGYGQQVLQNRVARADRHAASAGSLPG